MTTNYNEIAQDYKEAKLHPWRTHIERYTLTQLAGDVRGKSILDLACGEGYYSREWRRRGAAPVLGVDLSEGMITLAQTAETQAPLGVEYQVGDARCLVSPRKYDLVFAAYLLNYAQTREELAEMCFVIARSLKPGGQFLTVNNSPTDPPENFGRRDYGYSKELVGELKEGAPIIWRFFLPGKEVAVENYHMGLETMEAAFRAAGLRDVRWHQPLLSPEGIRESGAEYWSDFLSKPPVAFISATR